MQSKSLLIAIAAFAVTATGAQAYVGASYLKQSGLSIQQVEAFNEARELRRKGEIEKARDVLLEAGVNEETVASLRQASHSSHLAIHEAVLAGNFTAFKLAVEGTPLYDIITTEADFELFKQAHNLKLGGRFTEAKEILANLGVSPRQMHGSPHRVLPNESFLELTNEQRDALRSARQANDQETVNAILEEAGINQLPAKNKMGRHHWF